MIGAAPPLLSEATVSSTMSISPGVTCGVVLVVDADEWPTVAPTGAPTPSTTTSGMLARNPSVVDPSALLCVRTNVEPAVLASASNSTT